MDKFSVGHLADCGGRAIEVYRASEVEARVAELEAERNAYRSIAGYAMNGTDEVDELAKLPALERDRTTIERQRARFWQATNAMLTIARAADQPSGSQS